jgi:DNA (cytosine-5)-methyltransferase 1
MNPWAINRWLTDLDVKTLLLENVPEFVQWGPIDSNGKIIKEKKGLYFESWVRSIWELGYHVEWRFLVAADYGDATTRRRFFLIARKDGVPIRWPEPTHTGKGTGQFDELPKWRAAREIIDWSNKGRSLLDDPKYKRKPLSINTRRRIARGFEKYGGAFANLYIELLGLSGEGGGTGTPEAFTIPNRKNGKARSMDEPVYTITASNGGGGLLKVEPVIEPFTMANRSNNVPRSADEPIHTITAENMGSIYVVQTEAEPFVLGQQSCSAARDTGEPLMTVATAGAISLVEPQLVVFHGKSNTSEIDNPVPSQPTKSKIGLVNPQILKYYGTKKDTESVDDPLSTVTTKSRFGLIDPTAEPFIVQNRLIYGGKNDPTRAPHDINKPLPTVTGHGAGALVNPVILQVNHGDGTAVNRTRKVDDPLPALTTKRNLGIAEPVLKNVDGGPVDPRRLIYVDGVPYLLDIRFRMLTNRELARAMGFDDNESEYEFVGNVAEVTKQIGNAVPVNTACALVKAILKGE